MTEIVIFPLAESSVQIFTCECDLTPIAEQPILVTQKKTPPVPYGPTLTAARSVLCSVRRSRYPWVTFLVIFTKLSLKMVLMDINKKVTHVRDVRHHANCLEKKSQTIRIYECFGFVPSYVSTDTTKKFVRRAHSVTHSYGKCKPIAGCSFF